jgi:hypothetical protein
MGRRGELSSHQRTIQGWSHEILREDRSNDVLLEEIHADLLTCSETQTDSQVDVSTMPTTSMNVSPGKVLYQRLMT